MSWRLRVVHATEYEYTAPVTVSFNEARLTPRSDLRQSVVHKRVETVPATRTHRYTDYWGTEVTAFDLHAPHTSLRVTGMCEVETEAPAPSGNALTWEELASPEIRDDLDEYLAPTALVTPHPELTAAARDLASGLEPAQVPARVGQWVHEQFDYVPGSTGVHSSSADAWADRKGVCQDYAHVMLTMLRSLGIPARYVSGYLYPEPDAEIGRTIAGDSHAWVEAFTGDWRGYDPTNNVPIGTRHVSVGYGRDYADVPPLKGIFTGGAASGLKVTVELTRLA
jgi:transglutaminase-like putative cysteine protease